MEFLEIGNYMYYRWSIDDGYDILRNTVLNSMLVPDIFLVCLLDMVGPSLAVNSTYTACNFIPKCSLWLGFCARINITYVIPPLCCMPRSRNVLQTVFSAVRKFAAGHWFWQARISPFCQQSWLRKEGREPSWAASVAYWNFGEFLKGPRSVGDFWKSISVVHYLSGWLFLNMSSFVIRFRNEWTVMNGKSLLHGIVLWPK